MAETSRYRLDASAIDAGRTFRPDTSRIANLDNSTNRDIQAISKAMGMDPPVSQWTPDFNRQFTSWLRLQQAEVMGPGKADGWLGAGSLGLKGDGAPSLKDKLAPEAYDALKRLYDSGAYKSLHFRNENHSATIVDLQETLAKADTAAIAAVGAGLVAGRAAAAAPDFIVSHEGPARLPSRPAAQLIEFTPARPGSFAPESVLRLPAPEGEVIRLPGRGSVTALPEPARPIPLIEGNDLITNGRPAGAAANEPYRPRITTSDRMGPDFNAAARSNPPAAIEARPVPVEPVKPAAIEPVRPVAPAEFSVVELGPDGIARPVEIEVIDAPRVTVEPVQVEAPRAPIPEVSVPEIRSQFAESAAPSAGGSRMEVAPEAIRVVDGEIIPPRAEVSVPARPAVEAPVVEAPVVEIRTADRISSAVGEAAIGIAAGGLIEAGVAMTVGAARGERGAELEQTTVAGVTGLREIQALRQGNTSEAAGLAVEDAIGIGGAIGTVAVVGSVVATAPVSALVAAGAVGGFAAFQVGNAIAAAAGLDVDEGMLYQAVDRWWNDPANNAKLDGAISDAAQAGSAADPQFEATLAGAVTAAGASYDVSTPEGRTQALLDEKVRTGLAEGFKTQGTPESLEAAAAMDTIGSVLNDRAALQQEYGAASRASMQEQQTLYDQMAEGYPGGEEEFLHRISLITTDSTVIREGTPYTVDTPEQAMQALRSDNVRAALQESLLQEHRGLISGNSWRETFIGADQEDLDRAGKLLPVMETLDRFAGEDRTLERSQRKLGEVGGLEGAPPPASRADTAPAMGR